MLSAANDVGFIETETFERSHFAIRQLKASLEDEQVAKLASEVIRRIAASDTGLVVCIPDPTQAELIQLCKALVFDDDTAAARIIATARCDGVSAETVYLKYLAAAARMLGVWWTEDQISFTQVTVGTARMFAIMRGMKHFFQPTHFSDDKFAIFASVPGENHTLGVCMAADLFRKDGWEIALKLGTNHDELVADIVQNPANILGLSISGLHSIDALSRLVVALNICCPHTPIVVSGQDIDDVKPLLELMDVDGIAEGIEDAKEKMYKLLNKNKAVMPSI